MLAAADANVGEVEIMLGRVEPILLAGGIDLGASRFDGTKGEMREVEDNKGQQQQSR